MAELVERSLPIPEVQVSNPVIAKNLYWTFTVKCIEKMKIKKKRPGMVHFFKKVFKMANPCLLLCLFSFILHCNSNRNSKSIDVVLGILTRGRWGSRCRRIHWGVAATLLLSLFYILLPLSRYLGREEAVKGKVDPNNSRESRKQEILNDCKIALIQFSGMLQP